MSTELVICGASGTGLDVLDLVRALNGSGADLSVSGFLDDAKAGATFGGLPVLGPLSDAGRFPAARLIDALGGPRSFRSRADAIAQTGVASADFLTLVHPTALISPSAKVGPGSLVFGYVVVGAQATIGDHVTVLTHAVVHHEASVGDWSILASHVGISGRARVGTACYLGTGAHLVQDGNVGDGAMVGMGAVVIRPVAPGTTVVGNPARRLPDG